MKEGKKAVRAAFRAAVFKRAARGTGRPKCERCGAQEWPLDAHHIIPREDMPNGGYIISNGIALCDFSIDIPGEQWARGCHWKAESWPDHPTYCRAALFAIIGSSEEQARREDAR